MSLRKTSAQIGQGWTFWLACVPWLLIAFVTPAVAMPMSTVTLFHLRGGIYIGEDHEFAKVNVVVYVGPNAVTVVGATWTPASARALANAIRKVTQLPITAVINTDYNPEYVGGNAYWKSIGAQILSTKLTAALITKNWTSECAFIRRYYPDFPEITPTLPTHTYTGNFTLQSGRIRALYLGPSHTKDDIFVYFPKEKVLYAGSILKEHIGDLAFADLKAYPKTLRKLKALHLPIDFIISGHWSAVHGPELIDQYLAMLRAHKR